MNLSDFRLWMRHFTGSIYVPMEGRGVLKQLDSAGPDAFLKELERLSSLGSPWASAMLGYIYLYPSCGPHRNPERAVSVCEKTAEAGDLYSQFVLAWALLLAGKNVQALGWMKSAGMRHRFPPATMDLTRFVWNGWGLSDADPRRAVHLLKYARKVRSNAAVSLRCAYFRTGRVGRVWKFVGNAVAPAVAIRYGTALLMNPFSSENLLFNPQADFSLLRNLPAP